jgi:hypothetical protein
MTLIENKVDITIQLAKKGKCNPDLFNSIPEENIVELKRETLNISENEIVKALTKIGQCDLSATDTHGNDFSTYYSVL